MATEDTQRRRALWARYEAATSESGATLERVAHHTPTELRAVTAAATERQRLLRARVDRARLTPPAPMVPATVPVRLALAVLLLEDDADYRAALATLLRRAFRVPVYAAATAGEARQLWYDHRCAVVISDMHLGASVGGETLLASLPPTVRRVLMSGTADPATLREGARIAGATPWAKGADADALLTLVGALLDQVRPLVG